MKRKKGIKGMLGGALAIFLAFGLSATAQALSVPIGVDPSDPSQCTVKTSTWDHNTGSSGISLRTAIYFANNYETYGACTGRITLEEDVKMDTPLVITKDGVEIDGNGKMLDAKDMDATKETDGLDGQNCAILIDAKDVKIRNLSLSNSAEAPHSALCINGNRNMIEGVAINNGQYSVYFGDGAQENRLLPNVDLLGASKFALADHTEQGSGNIVIHTNNVVESDDWGDVVDSNGIVEWAVDEITSQVLRLSIDDMLGDYSYALGQTGEEEMKLQMSASGGRLLESSSPYIPILTEPIDKKGGAERFELTGAFVKFPPEAFEKDGEAQYYGYEPFNCDQGIVEPLIRRLAIYAIKGGEMKFVALVGESKSRGVDSEIGIFNFNIDTGDSPEAFGDIDAFVMVPVAPDGTLVGRASNYKRLAMGQSDCLPNTFPQGAGGSYGGGGSPLTGIDSIIEYLTVGTCNLDLAFIPGSMSEDTDSDLDSIPDYIERGIMEKTVTYVYDDDNDPLTPDVSVTEQTWVFDPANASCGCDVANKVLSCWYKPDTDNDGIKDGNDGYIEENWTRFYNIDDPRSRIEDLDPAAIFDRIVAAVDTDGAYTAPGASDAPPLPDVLDVDSDNDGLKDGEEHRTRLFTEKAPAYFRQLEGVGQPIYRDSSGNPVDCSHVLEDEGLSYVGISYGVYIYGGVGNDYLNEPIRLTDFTDLTALDKEGRKVSFLQCINAMLMTDTNFNGRYDAERGETDARDPDTDDDCVCDGEGVGCAEIDNMTSMISTNSCLDDHNDVPTMDNPAWLNDNCPETREPTSVCSPGCIEGEILMPVKALAPEYVTGEGFSGAELRLVDNDRNGVPDLFERKVVDPETGVELPDWDFVDRVCSDVDKDGIPDCVERLETNCEPTSSTDRQLNPYKKDSDGDGLVDGMAGGSKADVCPMDKADQGRSDEFNGTDSGYSCDPRNEVYTSGGVPNILSCFLDRDNDGLRDCEEDRDMDGYEDEPVPLEENGIFLSESDPLAVDTDEDIVGDFNEVRGWPYPTNPNNRDTDGDGMIDSEEDRNGDMWIDINFLEGQGCQNALIDVNGERRDTDPRTADTDGDGLNDKLELDGQDIDRADFLQMIGDPTVWTEGGIPHISNPLAQDSDGDDLDDNEEYDGMHIFYQGSNPCLPDSDGDGKKDNEEPAGCRLNPHPNCEPSGEVDTDSDGLSDRCEEKMGTLVNQEDTDGDGVLDGDEDINPNCIYEPHLGETNPLDPDTDGDNLGDGFELRYGTDPTNMDTDGDCIPDGIEDANLNGYFDMGAETNAISADTDGDGLPDGWVASSGMGEDLDCDGVRDVDANGVYTETDPRNPDSDLDGRTDYEEMMHGGYFNIANRDRANTGREGCQLVAGTSAAPTSMYYLFGLILLATRLAVRRMRKRPCLRKDRE